MDYRAIAMETVRILADGGYTCGGRRVDILEECKRAVEASRLIAPEDWAGMVIPSRRGETACTVTNRSAVDAVLDFARQGLDRVGVLNFASARNPGGGFLNGAMAQEESLASSSGLYPALLAHPLYYERNRACRSMLYTDHAIYSPGVVFFRDGRFRLVEKPASAAVLTLPAVNRGAALRQGEDPALADGRMRARMRLALLAFAAMGDTRLILGAFGCGVFRNDPAMVAAEWEALLSGEFAGVFERVEFAVLDRTAERACYAPFAARFGG